MAGTPGARIIAVHQPHRYTRLHSLFDEFCTCFNEADVVAIADVYSAGEDPIPGASRDDLVAGLIAHGHRHARGLIDEADLARLVKEQARPGDMVVCLGAGTISAWANALPAKLKATIATATEAASADMQWKALDRYSKDYVELQTKVADLSRANNDMNNLLAGTGIGTFSDRARDYVRGGSPFDGGDAIRKTQGFGNGALVDANEVDGVDLAGERQAGVERALEILMQAGSLSPDGAICGGRWRHGDNQSGLNLFSPSSMHSVRMTSGFQLP